MNDKIDANGLTSASRRLRLEQFARDAERARDEYAAESRVLDERTERLRQQRLARDAAEKAAGRPTARKRTAGKAK